jgi:hypothetical protein
MYVDNNINDLVINEQGDLLLVQCENNNNLFILMFHNQKFQHVKYIESAQKIFISEF